MNRITGVGSLLSALSAGLMAVLIVTAGVTPSRADLGGPATKKPSCPSGWYYSSRCNACAKRCGSGKVWSCGAKACVRRSSEKLDDAGLYKEAASLAEAGAFTNALELLWAIEDRDQAKVLTAIGYATRKLGNVERGIDYYHKALALDPDHVRAREYLGEGYLQLGDVGKAREQLGEIAVRCGTGCREYKMLTAAIVTHVTGEPAGTATW